MRWQCFWASPPPPRHPHNPTHAGTHTPRGRVIHLRVHCNTTYWPHPLGRFSNRKLRAQLTADPETLVLSYPWQTSFRGTYRCTPRAQFSGLRPDHNPASGSEAMETGPATEFRVGPCPRPPHGCPKQVSSLSLCRLLPQAGKGS